MRGNSINPHTVKKDIARRGRLESANNSECGCFAAPTRTQQCEEFFIVYIEVDIIENKLVVKRHDDGFDLNKAIGAEFVITKPSEGRGELILFANRIS